MSRMKMAAACVLLMDALLMPMPSGLAATTYTYDDLGRLVTVAYDNGQTITYTYDQAGNRTTVATAGNSPPVAVNDAITTNANAAKTFDPRTNDSDVDGDTLTITAKTNGAHGTVTINSGTSVTYTPATNYGGTDSFTYTISDGHSHTATATVSVTIYNFPIAVNDSITTNENTAKTFDPRTNDSDPDGGALTISAKTNGAHGTVTINSGTSLTYTPVTNYWGSDSFTYTIENPHNLTDTATVAVTVTHINQPPVLVNDSATAYGISGTSCAQPTGGVSVFDNDSDPDGDTLTITSFSTPAHGTLVNNGGGVFTYTGTRCLFVENGTDSFTYTASDGHGHTGTATVNMTLIVTNHGP